MSLQTCGEGELVLAAGDGALRSWRQAREQLTVRETTTGEEFCQLLPRGDACRSDRHTCSSVQLTLFEPTGCNTAQGCTSTLTPTPCPQRYQTKRSSFVWFISSNYMYPLFKQYIEKKSRLRRYPLLTLLHLTKEPRLPPAAAIALGRPAYIYSLHV